MTQYTRRGSGIEKASHVSWFDLNKRQPGEPEGDYYNRFCAHMAVRSQEPEHLAYLARKEGEAAKQDIERQKRERKQQQAMVEDRFRKGRERELERRRKMRDEGLAEAYPATGRPWDLQWARAEVSPFCDDFRPGTMLPGLGILALRMGIDRLEELRRNGKPIKQPTAFVVTIARMVHEGRFTQWVDPNQPFFDESLLVPEGQSPFDKKALRGDNGEWDFGKDQGEWKMIVPNDEGWLPGQPRPDKEAAQLTLPSEDKTVTTDYDLDATKQRLAQLQKDREALDAEQRVLSLRLNTQPRKQAAVAQHPENPPPKTDPPPAPPTQQKTWRDIHLYSVMPEMRGVELPATWNKTNLGAILEFMRRTDMMALPAKERTQYLYEAMARYVDGTSVPKTGWGQTLRQPGED